MDTKIYRDFFKKFAINVGQRELSHALESASEMLRTHPDSHKPGFFFKSVLAELDRMIDWKFAEDLEKEFEKFVG